VSNRLISGSRTVGIGIVGLRWRVDGRIIAWLRRVGRMTN